MADIFSPFPSCYTARSDWKVKKPAASHKSDKSRRGLKAKSWTQEEERFLLVSRQSRVPYRHIAERLHKTELACRLHYHQLVVVRPQQTNDQASCASGPSHTPGSSYSTSSRPSPQLSRRITTPPSDQSALSSLTSWLELLRKQRSLSAPVPLRERCNTTPPPLDLSKKDKKKNMINREEVFAFITPPTPPTNTSQFTPPPITGSSSTLSSSTGSTFSLPPLSTFTASPSTSASPGCLTPSPTLSADLAGSGGAANWRRGHSTRWPSMDLGRDESGAAWLMPSPTPTCGVSGAVAVAAVAGEDGGGNKKSSERCSVYSLLNHDDDDYCH